MPKSTTTKEQKTVVADKVNSVAEKTATEKANGNTEKTVQKTENNSGFPFVVKDGFVEIVLKQFAKKSLYGTTGELIKFDENGKAKVVLEEALYFKNMQGIEYVK